MSVPNRNPTSSWTNLPICVVLCVLGVVCPIMSRPVWHPLFFEEKKKKKKKEVPPTILFPGLTTAFSSLEAVHALWHSFYSALVLLPWSDVLFLLCFSTKILLKKCITCHKYTFPLFFSLPFKDGLSTSGKPGLRAGICAASDSIAVLPWNAWLCVWFGKAGK